MRVSIRFFQGGGFVLGSKQHLHAEAGILRKPHKLYDLPAPPGYHQSF